MDLKISSNRKKIDKLKELEKSKPVITCGDLNVAHTEIDLARPKNNTKNAGFTQEERSGFQRYLEKPLLLTQVTKILCLGILLYLKK